MTQGTAGTEPAVHSEPPGNSLPAPEQGPVLPLIMVVDDDEFTRILAYEALVGAGFDVIEAGSGPEALEVFASRRPDIVLLDLMMPGMGGHETCEQLRRLPGGEHVPVMMMTGSDDVDDIERSYVVGATDFITKPINYTILTQRMRYVIRAKRVADEFREQASLLASSERVARVGHWAWDPAARTVRSSEQLVNILGAPLPAEVDSYRRLCNFVHPEDRNDLERCISGVMRDRQRASVEHRVVRPDGEVRFVHHEIDVLQSLDGDLGRLLGTLQDITGRLEAEQKIRYLAYYDPVTGLPNRTLFNDQLNHALVQAKRYGRCAAVMFCDLDHFKRVNDTLGHAVGDELLCIVADRLRESVRECDFIFRESGAEAVDEHAVARLGGDEFVIMLAEVRSPEDTGMVAERICNAIAEPIEVGGTTVYVSCSLGISNFPDDGEDVVSLLKHADAAMYHAKGEGRNQYRFYTKAVNARVLERMALENSLRTALELGEFQVHYQPKVKTDTHEILGVEALLRWNSPTMGTVSPERFIPLAEDIGLIAPIGEWVLREACAQAAAWRQQGFGDIRMSVNLSPAQFKSADLAKVVLSVLDETGLPRHLLELELTESVLMDDVEGSAEILSELAQLGVHVAIDDFGVGYSSLAYLRRFPVSTLKIDYSFVRDVANNEDDAAIVAATIALGHSLRLNVTAEGVENRDQLDFLRAHNCDESQGFLFSEPVGADQMTEWMRSHRDDESERSDPD